jgi:hypothetical protein
MSMSHAAFGLLLVMTVTSRPASADGSPSYNSTSGESMLLPMLATSPSFLEADSEAATGNRETRATLLGNQATNDLGSNAAIMSPALAFSINHLNPLTEMLDRLHAWDEDPIFIGCCGGFTR